MTAARSWLPAGTPPPPALQSLLSAAVGGWARRWFAGDPLDLGPLRRAGSTGLDWHALDVGLMLGVSPGAVAGIGARVLGLAPDARLGADRTLLEEVAQECLADLRTGLAALAEAPRHAEWHPAVAPPGWRSAIGDTRAGLEVALSDALFARLVRRLLPPPASPPLGSGAAALSGIRVSASAAIGRSALSVADLRGLGIGDVLVLDRRIDEAVPIAVDGRPLDRGQVAVVPAEPLPLLKIVDALQ